jgi:methylenetetrahydrofolate--tRNA-(uracil-5-)-methyltransferase
VLLAVCAGPLAGESLSRSLLRLLGGESLYFYDAIAPIVEGESLNREIIFSGSRYGQGEGDYLNCPMNREEYLVFYHALLEAEKTPAKDFEKIIHFEGCMPIEALAERGERTLAFGPLKPVGFTDPRSGRRPFALLQLRAENLNRSMFNLVGCQTKLTQREQERIFRLIPGMEQARFARYGSMHRNTFVNAPRVLNPDLSLRAAPHIFLAGQITGVEGYVESAACGLWLGLLLAAHARGRDLPPPPPQSALGALLLHLRSATDNFQPSNIQYGLMPALEARAGKADRKALYARRAELAFREWMNGLGAPPAPIMDVGVKDV